MTVSTLEQAETPRKVLSKYENVTLELVETEESYINDMQSILDNYSRFFNVFDSDHIFSSMRQHIKKLVEFGQVVSKSLSSVINDPEKFCQFFIDRNEEFAKYFGEYCEVFPLVSSLLENMDPQAANAKLIEECRISSKQLLPLSSYLLKPLQRLLKYHLLLESIEKDSHTDNAIKPIVREAIGKMKFVADTINERQRLQDGIAQLPKIKRKIVNLTEPLKFSDVGPVVLHQNVLVNNRPKSVILFENVILICYALDNDTLAVKEGMTFEDLVLLEDTNKDPLVFTIHGQKNSRKVYHIKVKTTTSKSQWILHIKRLILKNLDVEFGEDKLSAMFGKENATKFICMSNVHNLKSIEKAFASLESEHNDLQTDPAPKLSSSRTSLALPQKAKKFDLKTLLSQRSEPIIREKKTLNEKTKKTVFKSQSDKEKTVNTVADVIDAINNDQDLRDQNIEMPWSKTFINDAAEEIRQILDEDSDKYSSKSLDVSYESELKPTPSSHRNNVSSDIETKMIDRFTTDSSSVNSSGMTPQSPWVPAETDANTARLSHSLFDMSTTDTAKSPESPKSPTVQNKMPVNICEIPEQSELFSPVSDKPPQESKEKKELSESKEDVKKSVGTSESQAAEEETRRQEESKNENPSIVQKYFPTLPQDAKPNNNGQKQNIEEIPKNIVRSIIGVINTYNKTDDKSDVGHPNITTINKASRIGNILLKLQQDYLESQEKFKQKAEPLKIGKRGIPLDRFLQDDRPRPQ